jgi:hypothetical protein
MGKHLTICVSLFYATTCSADSLKGHFGIVPAVDDIGVVVKINPELSKSNPVCLNRGVLVYILKSLQNWASDFDLKAYIEILNGSETQDPNNHNTSVWRQHHCNSEINLSLNSTNEITGRLLVTYTSYITDMPDSSAPSTHTNIEDITPLPK